MPNAAVENPAASLRPSAIRKAILLDVAVDVQLWVEGNDAAPHDYAASTIEAVRAMITERGNKQHRLHVVIKDIREHEEP